MTGNQSRLSDLPKLSHLEAALLVEIRDEQLTSQEIKNNIRKKHNYAFSKNYFNKLAEKLENDGYLVKSKTPREVYSPPRSNSYQATREGKLALKFSIEFYDSLKN